jgi:metal-responsive CopG/Arc/MetJ family transcriptional regulator
MADLSNREFTVSFPEDLARKVDLLAEQESRDTSELFREAFRVYFARQIRARMNESRELAGGFNPLAYNREDTRRLLEEARREMKSSPK